MKYIAFVLIAMSVASARPEKDNVPINMVTVPTNCPDGQQLVNGVCRDIWRFALQPNLPMDEEVVRYKEDNVPMNMVTVPTNCPDGQQLVNGVCRDIWRLALQPNLPMDEEVVPYKEDNVPMNMVTVPTNCPDGQQLVNGVCRDIWRLALQPNLPMDEEVAQYIKENAPLNMISVPPNCPPGQQLVNGMCRDIWRFEPTSPIPSMAKETESKLLYELVKRINSALIYQREKRQLDFDAEEILQLLDDTNTNRNIISVPNQCPTGYKPDILGICRPIFD